MSLLARHLTASPRFRLRLPGLVLAAAAAVVTTAVATPAAAKQQDCSSTKQYYPNNHRISAWKLNFGGWACRTWDNSASWLWVNLGQNKGGFDAGIGKNIASGKRVDNMALKKGVSAKVTIKNIKGSGHYWLGPKTIISSTKSYSGLKGQYECYIVEKAKKSPNDLVKWAKLKYRGQGTYDGSVYKHYTVTYEGILQIWSIRQKYRNGGWTSVGYIQRDWRRLGLTKNWFNLGWKYNVETNGKISGEIGFSNLNLPWN